MIFSPQKSAKNDPVIKKGESGSRLFIFFFLEISKTIEKIPPIKKLMNIPVTI